MNKYSYCAFLLLFSLTALHAGEPVRLSSLEMPAVFQEWGNGAPQVNKAAGGKPLSIAGKTFEHGVGIHAPYSLFVNLDSACRKFSTQVGVDDGAADKAISSKNPMFGGGGFNTENVNKAKHHIVVSFQIYGDGKPLFDSGRMKPGDEPEAVDLDLTGPESIMVKP